MQYFPKYCIKRVMVKLIEKSQNTQFSSEEYDLLNALRKLVCNSGLLDSHIEKADALMGQFGDDITGGLSGSVSDIYMAPTIDKSLRLENDLNEQLMHLSLVDICGKFNVDSRL